MASPSSLINANSDFELSEEEPKLSFSNPLYFGKNFHRMVRKDGSLGRTIEYLLMKMLTQGVMNFDGTVDMEFVEETTKEQLWTYILYLWKNNVDIKVFYEMGDEHMPSKSKIPVYKPNPDKFVNVVKDVLKMYVLPTEMRAQTQYPSTYLDNWELMSFINCVFKLNKARDENGNRRERPINIKFLELLFDKLIDRIQAEESSLEEMINGLAKRSDKLKHLIEASSLDAKLTDGIHLYPLLTDSVQISIDKNGNHNRQYKLSPGK